MKNIRHSILLLSFCQLLTLLAPVYARGSGHAWYDPNEFKVVRDEHAWNGDSYMSDYDKACTYKNYKMSNGMHVGAMGNTYNSAGQLANYRDGVTWDGQGGGGGNYTAASGSANYSGPAYIGPANYGSVVQTYSWPAKR